MAWIIITVVFLIMIGLILYFSFRDDNESIPEKPYQEKTNALWNNSRTIFLENGESLTLKDEVINVTGNTNVNVAIAGNNDLISVTPNSGKNLKKTTIEIGKYFGDENKITTLIVTNKDE